jgi:hypothetical protein
MIGTRLPQITNILNSYDNFITQTKCQTLKKELSRKIGLYFDISHYFFYKIPKPSISRLQDCMYKTISQNIKSNRFNYNYLHTN